MIMHCVMCTGPDLFLPHTRTEPGMGQEGTWPDRRVRYVIIPYEFCMRSPYCVRLGAHFMWLKRSSAIIGC